MKWKYYFWCAKIHSHLNSTASKTSEMIHLNIVWWIKNRFLQEMGLSSWLWRSVNKRLWNSMNGMPRCFRDHPELLWWYFCKFKILPKTSHIDTHTHTNQHTHTHTPKHSFIACHCFNSNNTFLWHFKFVNLFSI